MKTMSWPDEIKWVHQPTNGIKVFRADVPGGWLVLVDGRDSNYYIKTAAAFSTVFVPDPDCTTTSEEVRKKTKKTEAVVKAKKQRGLLEF